MEEKIAQGGEAAADGVSAASQALQTFATEMQRFSKESIEQASHVLDELRNVKSVPEVVSLQTTYIQQSFQRYSTFATRMGELMAANQSSFLQQGQAAMQAFKPPGFGG